MATNDITPAEQRVLDALRVENYRTAGEWLTGALVALREYGEKQKATGFVAGFDTAKEAYDTCIDAHK